MHFEILIEDKSGKVLLENIINKLIDVKMHTFNIIAFKGIGRIPKKINSSKRAAEKSLLSKLPKIIKAYGKMYPKTAEFHAGALIVICDLDDKCLKSFREQLYGLVANCDPQPTTKFCIAVEEGEAWLLGDKSAIKQAYPSAKRTLLKSYEYDSICNTWEKLADAICKGGSQKLSREGWQAIGRAKSQWAINISKYMKIDRNQSPSFNYFKKQLEILAEK
jgi:hypothetical protein